MKRSSPLWGSVSVLIGVVIAILALVRGAWLVPLLLLTFTAWGLWVVMFQLQPAWDSIRGYRKKEHDARKQREASLYSTAQANADAMQLLLRHVNHRISAYRNSVVSFCNTAPLLISVFFSAPLANQKGARYNMTRRTKMVIFKEA